MTNGFGVLFDDLDEGASLGAATRKDAGALPAGNASLEPNDAPSVVVHGQPRTWREIPQAVYLSWSWKRQMLYCAARDDAAAREADTAEEAAWHTERAALYRKDVANG